MVKVKDKKSKNMYSDSVKQWNVLVGCTFSCSYCKRSFQAQMKRQKPKFDENGKQWRGCQDCYDYKHHFHPERLINKYVKKLPNTKGDEFIWVCSSGDIACMRPEWVKKVLNVIRELPQTFFMQTKNPMCFEQYDLPKNLIIGITLESNKWFKEISKAVKPTWRALDFMEIEHPRKIVTVEPIMKFDFDMMVDLIKDINPERVYIGYNSKPKSCKLPEPSLVKTKRLIEVLSKFTKVKIKLLRKAWNEP